MNDTWESPIPEASHFYEAIRESTICVICFAVLYSVSYIGLRRYQLRDDDDEDNSGWISVSLAASALAWALSAIFLLPVTIIAHQILLNYPENFYMQWLTADLLHAIWNVVFIGCNVSLLLVLPFAYFYYEAEGRAGRSLTSRLYESLVMQSLLTSVYFGFVTLITAVLSDDFRSVSLYNIWRRIIDLFPISYSIVSLAGALLFLGATSAGFYRLLKLAGGLFTPPGHLDDRINALKIESAAVRLILQRHVTSGSRAPGMTHRPRPLVLDLTANPDELDETALRAKLEDMERNLEKCRQERKQSAWYRNIKFLLFMSVCGVCSSAILLRVFYAQSYAMLIADVDRLDPASIGQTKAQSTFEATFKVALLLYLSLAALSGLHHVPLIRKMRLVVRGTSVRALIGNSALALAIGSALPVVARLLRLTSFDLMGYYGTMPFLSHEWTVTIYDTAFLLSTVPFAGGLVVRTVRRWRGQTVPADPLSPRSPVTPQLPITHKRADFDD